MPMITKLNKSLFINLSFIKGVGNKKAQKICESLGVSLNTPFEDLSTHKKDALNAILTGLKKSNPGTEETLKKNIQLNIERLINNQSYRRKTT